MTRQLTTNELRFIEQVASRLDTQQSVQLLDDLKVVRARPDRDGSRLLFDIPGYVRPVYEGQRRFAAEGRMRDIDGADITVSLYADENGRLFELEFIRWGDGAPINPDWSTLEIY